MPLTITNVEFANNLRPSLILLGEPVPAFDVVYELNNKYYLANCTDPVTANAAFMTVHTGTAGLWVCAVPFVGTWKFTGPTLVQGQQYVLSATPGKVDLKSVLVTGNLVTELFVASDPTTGRLSLDVTGIAVA